MKLSDKVIISLYFSQMIIEDDDDSLSSRDHKTESSLSKLREVSLWFHTGYPETTNMTENNQCRLNQKENIG